IPDKSGYRKFKIKTVSGRDDFAMIGEIIKRRYYRLLEENSELPDLIVIDGGKGQLSAAVKSLASLGLKLPCVSLAKENEEIYTKKSKTPIVIPRNKPSLKILQYARDETHRFGVAYNRTIRKNQIK
ncbi:MAG: excinuclease ABC subunit C, partial [Nitrosopumilus sp.]|nr:excinuclease ABC subunit C [Nitrosopumilus sp.]